MATHSAPAVGLGFGIRLGLSHLLIGLGFVLCFLAITADIHCVSSDHSDLV